MIGSGVTRPSSIIRMKRGRSCRMRTLPFWALRIAPALHGDAHLRERHGRVRRRSMLVSTTVPPRRDISTACVCADGTVAASRT